MKTANFTSLKDNVASAVLMTATLFAIAGTIINSNDARADLVPQAAEQMDAIVVTAERMPVAQLEPIVVTAKR